MIVSYRSVITDYLLQSIQIGKDMIDLLKRESNF